MRFDQIYFCSKNNMKMTNRPTYSLGTSDWESPTGQQQQQQHTSKDDQRNRKYPRRRGSDDLDAADGNASLTYSAASSVNSGGSAAGESNDSSSFAEVMRVLDLQDSFELKEFIRKEGVSVTELRNRKLSSGQSLASASLAYSADGDSHLDGTMLLQTIAG